MREPLAVFALALILTALIVAADLALSALALRRRRPAPRFAGGGPALTLGLAAAAVFEVDSTKRTVSGLILPWDTEARSGGRTWSFPPGSVTYGADTSRVKLWVDHDVTKAVGFAATLENRPDADIPGLYGTFKVARGADGDAALASAEDHVRDGFSVGIAEGGQYEERDGVTYAIAAPLMETSLTPAPAFDDARVHDVAATAAPTGRNTMECTTCGVIHAAGITACDPAAVAAFSAAHPTPPGTAPVGQPVDLDDLVSRFAAALAASPAPTPVPAALGLEVNEASPYRFDGLEGAHEFSDDLVQFGRHRDGDAGERLMAFMADAFAPGIRNPRFDVERANVTGINPSPTRPDMYVNKRVFTTPVYDAIYSGAITDNTPFIVPKWSSDSGLVADHTEGDEPASGTFVVTSQTVTPTPLSGEVDITREVWDQGGNPQVSGLIWDRMQQEYYANLETAAAAVLTDAAASITDVTLTAGATDDDLVNALEGALVDLQFVAGAENIDTAMTHVDLYKALAAAVDSTGRKLLSLYGVTNSTGQARPKFASLDVAGYEFAPAKSLGATGTVAANSWLFDRGSVHLWNSAPQRLEFDVSVAKITMAIWGYKAAAVTDASGVRQVIYDPTA